jgi:patatin-related protein
MDALTAQRGIFWPRRGEFLTRNFERYRQWNIDPGSACFVDGSVLNNRPFREAIRAIRGRPAYREVDRRLVYIDPDPSSPAAAVRHRMPGFFSTLKGALSDIPSSEPIVDEIGWVNDFNDRVRRIRTIVAEARPRVSRLVERIVDAPPDRTITPAQVRAWREDVHEQVKRDAGFAYEGYVRLKLASVRDFVSHLITTLRGVPPQSPLARTIAAVVDAWSVQSGAAFEETDGIASANPEGKPGAQPMPAWVKFLLTFDIDYRRRRLHFLIEGQNRLYDVYGQDGVAGFDRVVVDRLKRLLYEKLDVLDRFEQATTFSRKAVEQVERLFPAAPSARDVRDLQRHAGLFVQFHERALDELIATLADEIGLDSGTDEVDRLLAGMDPADWNPAARREVLVNYLGFPFWDVLTFPVMTWREAGEFNEILVDRISPLDAHTIRAFSGPGSLMGVGFGHFAGFFSRAFREKDYLLGRLHGLDRLIDIVCDSAELDPGEIDVVAIKKRAFTLILDAEEPHLPNSGELFAALRRCVAELEVGANRQTPVS